MSDNLAPVPPLDSEEVPWYGPIADFFSPEAGQKRTQWLNNLGDEIAYYVPPPLRKPLGAIGEFTSAADMKGFLDHGGKAFEDIYSGEVLRNPMGTATSVLDSAGSVAAMMLPISYAKIQEAANAVPKFVTSTRYSDLDEIPLSELSEVPLYRGETFDPTLSRTHTRSAHGFGGADDGNFADDYIYATEDPVHAGGYAKGFERMDGKKTGNFTFTPESQIYKAHIPKNLNIFDMNNPEHAAIARKWAWKNIDGGPDAVRKVFDPKFPLNDGNVDMTWEEAVKAGNWDVIEKAGISKVSLPEFLKKHGFDGHRTTEAKGNIAIYNTENLISAFDPRIARGLNQGTEDVPYPY